LIAACCVALCRVGRKGLNHLRLCRRGRQKIVFAADDVGQKDGADAANDDAGKPLFHGTGHTPSRIRKVRTTPADEISPGRLQRLGLSVQLEDRPQNIANSSQIARKMIDPDPLLMVWDQ
jgi:hypothetical protein